MRPRLVFATFALPGLLVVLSCARGRAPAPTLAPPPEAPYPAPAQLYYDNGGGIQDSLRVIVRDAAMLERIWGYATSRQASPPVVPDINFDTEMVVLVAAGRMMPDDRIGVDGAAITRRTDSNGRDIEVLNVVVRTTTGCRAFDADAYPIEIVRLRRFDGTIAFIERRDQAAGCGSSAGARRGMPRSGPNLADT